MGLDVEAPVEASVTIDQDAAWRLMTKGMDPAEALQDATLTGEPALARRLLDVVSIIA